ncbi:MAG: MBL fold metallo-hydrolase [Saprospiraceae bacterium]|nr:MBL fold metallo-hydrolase [Saprospiraceae bacterium]
MKLTLLGTGTSQGVPVIGCDCAVCQSPDPRDQRLRTAALISTDDGQNILIDAGPDFRQQMLREKVRRLDAILLTHEHNDHVIGIDDVRPFNFSSGKAMSVYGLPRVTGELRKRFDYVFAEPIPGLPRIELKPIEAGDTLQLGSLTIEAIGVMHGRLPILGYRIGDLTYLTDVKTVSDEDFQRIYKTKYLIVNALQFKEHPTHMNLDEALRFIEKIQPERAWLIHMSHHIGLAADMESRLPTGVSLAYDGLVLHA